MTLFNIIVDLDWRDRRTPGLIKAIWAIFLIILSYVTALVYLAFRGKAMGPFERAKPPVPAKAERPTNISARRPVARAQEIADAKTLLEPARSPNRNSTRSKPKALSQT
jgi:hypothetical protein